MCKVVKRDDIIHCKICQVCVDLYDHHCDIFDICVCAKTYKFFILVLFYVALIFIQALFCFYRLLNCFNNIELRRYYEIRIDLLLIIMGVIAGLFVIFFFMFLWDSPISNPYITKRLDEIYKDKKLNLRRLSPKYAV